MPICQNKGIYAVIYLCAFGYASAAEVTTQPMHTALTTFLTEKCTTLQPITIPKRNKPDQKTTGDSEAILCNLYHQLKELTAPKTKTEEQCQPITEDASSQTDQDSDYHITYLEAIPENPIIDIFNVLEKFAKECKHRHRKKIASIPPTFLEIYRTRFISAIHAARTFFRTKNQETINPIFFGPFPSKAELEHFETPFRKLGLTPTLVQKKTVPRFDSKHNTRIFFSNHNNYSFTKKNESLLLSKQSDQTNEIIRVINQIPIQGHLLAGYFYEETQQGLLLLKPCGNTPDSYVIQPISYDGATKLLVHLPLPISIPEMPLSITKGKENDILAITTHNKVLVYKKTGETWNIYKKYSLSTPVDTIEFILEDTYLLGQYHENNEQTLLKVSDCPLLEKTTHALYTQTKDAKYVAIYNAGSCAIFEKTFLTEYKQLASFHLEGVTAISIEEIFQDVLRIKLVVHNQYIYSKLIYYNETTSLTIEDEPETTLDIGRLAKKILFPSPDICIALFPDNTCIYWELVPSDDDNIHYHPRTIPINQPNASIQSFQHNACIVQTADKIHRFDYEQLSLLSYLLLNTAPELHEKMVLPAPPTETQKPLSWLEHYLPEVNKELHTKDINEHFSFVFNFSDATKIFCVESQIPE